MIKVLNRQIHSTEALTEEYEWLVGGYSIEEKNLILNIQYTEWSKTFFKERESYLKFTGPLKQQPEVGMAHQVIGLQQYFFSKASFVRITAN